MVKMGILVFFPFNTVLEVLVGSNLAGKINNKRHPNWKVRIKTIFADGMFPYSENPNESTKRTARANDQTQQSSGVESQHTGSAAALSIISEPSKRN